MKSGNLNFVETSGHFGNVMGLIYLYLLHFRGVSVSEKYVKVLYLIFIIDTYFWICSCICVRVTWYQLNFMWLVSVTLRIILFQAKACVVNTLMNSVKIKSWIFLVLKISTVRITKECNNWTNNKKRTALVYIPGKERRKKVLFIHQRWAEFLQSQLLLYLHFIALVSFISW